MATKRHDDLSPAGKCMEVIDADNGIGILNISPVQPGEGEFEDEELTEEERALLLFISEKAHLLEAPGISDVDDEDGELMEEIENLFSGKR